MEKKKIAVRGGKAAGLKTAVLVSGGVDSSVALMLLKNAGYNVSAFYLKIWLEDEIKYLSECPWEEDLKFVREICARENIPLHIINMQKEYFETVVKYTLSEVKKGRTPNPDVMCNNRIKFGLFMEKIGEAAKEFGGPFDKIATGHYARTVEKKGFTYLKTSPDPVKDQTYFLSGLTQKQLQKLLFPVGAYTKKQVRALADKFDLPNKNRKDSQGICFLGKFKYSEFIKHYLGTKPGRIIDFDSGEELGAHEGYWYYTIGQRKGIRLGGGPYYVVAKDTRKNIVYVSKNYYAGDKKRNKLKVEDIGWNAAPPPAFRQKKSFSLKIKIRHSDYFYNCRMFPLGGGRALIKMKKNDQGLAPGQFAAFYRGDICLGSGIISQ